MIYLSTNVRRKFESIEKQVKTVKRGCQGKTQDVVVWAENGTRNGGTRLAVCKFVARRSSIASPLKIREKSVFEVDDSRLAIGVFTRPLLEREVRNFRHAWEQDPLPGFHEFELGRERISFVTPPENVSMAWKSIDRLLETATAGVRNAS